MRSYFLQQPAKFYEQTNVSRGVATSWATYVAGIWRITDRFTLAGGIRYNSDVREAIVNPFYTNLSIP